jgi:hypothetical protein
VNTVPSQRPAQFFQLARTTLLFAILLVSAAFPLAAPAAPVETRILTTSDVAAYEKTAAPVVVSPNMSVTGDIAIDSATILITANFESGDILSIAGQSGTSGAVDGLNWNYTSATGVLRITGNALPAVYQSALRKVTFSNLNENAGGQPRTVRFSLGSSLSSPATGHYYEFVTAPGIDWTDAKTAAAARNFFGLQGYLVTIGSADENAFVAARLNGEGWLGASDDVGQATTENNWVWATGPEAGTLFFIDGSGPVGDAYVNWEPGEPNNAVGGEHFAHFRTGGQWNDYSNTQYVSGYVVEYGGMPGDPTLQITDDVVVTITMPPPAIGALASIDRTNQDAYPVNGTCLRDADVTVTVGAVNVTVTCANDSTFSALLNLSALDDAAIVAVSATQGDGATTSAAAAAVTAKDTGRLKYFPVLANAPGGESVFSLSSER